MTGALRFGAAALVVALSCCTQTQEVTNTYSRPSPPRPRPAPAVPSGARADAMVLNVEASPVDTDGNGYPDRIRATVHLFDTRYAPPIHEDGAIVFVLHPSGAAGRPGTEPLRQWRFAEARLAEARGLSRFGACYRFQLSLLDEGTDAVNVSMADLACRFEPSDGRAPARAGGVATIQIGRRVLMP
jgi:hypothetical protein